MDESKKTKNGGWPGKRANGSNQNQGTAQVRIRSADHKTRHRWNEGLSDNDYKKHWKTTESSHTAKVTNGQ